LITGLQQTLDTLDGNLQGQIDNNLELIEIMQSKLVALDEELEIKQNIIDGKCPDGSAIIEVRENGGVVCGSSGGGTSPGQPLSIVKIWGSFAIGAGLDKGYLLFCNPDEIAIATSFQTTEGVHVRTANTQYIEAWGGWFGVVQATNTTDKERVVNMHVTCMSVEPVPE
jgi:hypothetical protein